MSHRQFLDTHGTLWTVWDVYPALVERDLSRALGRPSGGQPRVAPPHAILALDRLYDDGWLCFESLAGKRRLAPVPQGWDRLTGDALSDLCDRAMDVKPRRQASGARPEDTVPPPAA